MGVRVGWAGGSTQSCKLTSYDEARLRRYNVAPDRIALCLFVDIHIYNHKELLGRDVEIAAHHGCRT